MTHEEELELLDPKPLNKYAKRCCSRGETNLNRYKEMLKSIVEIEDQHDEEYEQECQKEYEQKDDEHEEREEESMIINTREPSIPIKSDKKGKTRQPSQPSCSQGASTSTLTSTSTSKSKSKSKSKKKKDEKKRKRTKSSS
jgi:hypothetical protein